MRDLANSFRWSYLLTVGRVLTDIPYNSGTITYQATSGAYPRLVTLTTTDGTSFPSWSVGAYIRVGFQAWKVSQMIDGFHLILDPQLNPGKDVLTVADIDDDDEDDYVGTPPTNGVEFQLYRDSYPMPADYIAQDQALYERNFGGMNYVHPREWLFEERFIFSQGTPQFFTVTGDVLYPGSLVMRIAPYPTDQKTIDFLYHRRPRELRLVAEVRGTATVAAQSNVVSGSGTFFNPNMVGSILRLSDTSQVAPTSVVGTYPAAFESVITGYVGANQVVVADNCPIALSGVKLVVSDALDIEEGAMLNAYLRGCESCLANVRTLKDKPDAQTLYARALAEAKSADSRTFSGRYVGDHLMTRRQRLVDMPINFNCE